MEPTSLSGPVYTYSPSVKAAKASGSSIRDYIDPNNQPGSAFNQAVAAADAAARASRAVQGKSVQDYVAANRGVFNFAASANGGNGQGMSIADYVADSTGVSSSAASTGAPLSSAAAAAALAPPQTGTAQGKTFHDYVGDAEGTASSAVSSATSAASSAAATAQQNAANTATGMTIQNYFAAAQGTSTP